MIPMKALRLYVYNESRGHAEAWGRVPTYCSNFSHLFGPIFPEILELQWVISCEGGGCYVVAIEADCYFPEDEHEAKAYEEWLARLKGMRREVTKKLEVVPGEYLIRLANHFDEDSFQLFGFQELPDVELFQNLSTFKMPFKLTPLAEIFFETNEGIWLAAFRNPRLYERVKAHCAMTTVYEDVPPQLIQDGSWLSYHPDRPETAIPHTTASMLDDLDEDTPVVTEVFSREEIERIARREIQGDVPMTLEELETMIARWELEDMEDFEDEDDSTDEEPGEPDPRADP